MNDEYTLSEVFNIVYEREFSEFNSPSRHRFSRRHRKEMKAILHPRRTRSIQNLPLTKRIVIAVLVIFLAVSGTTVGAAIFRGFVLKEQRDRTQLFGVDAQDAPKTIEYVYYLPNIPEGYELYEEVSNPRNNIVHYIKPSTNRIFAFCQYVKYNFIAEYDNEHSHLEPTEVNGKYGLCYELNGWSNLIWDNEDYILEISGDFTKDELIAFAESIEIKELQPTPPA